MHQRVGLDIPGFSDELGCHEFSLHIGADANTVASNSIGLPAAGTDLCERNRWLGDRAWRLRDVLRLDLSHNRWGRDLGEKRRSRR
jgi:hypothetical protein